MGRHKIRHFDSSHYEPDPHEVWREVIVSPANTVWLKRRDRLRKQGIDPYNRPRFGPGSGRAGGARAATHRVDHIRAGRIEPETSPQECPICRFGSKIWKLWNATNREEWELFWDEREQERDEFERFVDEYKAATTYDDLSDEEYYPPPPQDPIGRSSDDKTSDMQDVMI